MSSLKYFSTWKDYLFSFSLTSLRIVFYFALLPPHDPEGQVFAFLSELPISISLGTQIIADVDSP